MTKPTNHLIRWSTLSLAIALLLPTVSASTPNKASADVASTLQVQYQLLQPEYQQCPASPLRKEPGCYLSRLQLTLPFNHNSRDWRIYFSHLTPVIATLQPHLQIRHLNGDLHELSATAGFNGFTAGKPVAIDFISASGIFSQAMVPGNFLWQQGDAPAAVISSTNPELTDASGTPAFIKAFTQNNADFRQNGADQLGVASGESLYQHYQSQQLNSQTAASHTTNSQLRLIPSPTQLQLIQNQMVSTVGGFQLQLADAKLADALSAVLSQLSQQQLLKPTSKKPLKIQLSDGFASPEHYQLSINHQGITITAGGPAGAYYALQSLLGLHNQTQQQLPSAQLKDGPAFAYRGQHVDLARNFLGKDFVLDLISQMGRYKLNKLHLHLADDEGWRLAIRALPELTELGAHRCLDLSETSCLLPQLGAGINTNNLPNGALSQQDYLEILAHAKAHQVQVIPSLDMPGHSRAAVKAMALRAKRLHAEQHANWDQYLLTEAADQSRYLSIQYYNDNTLNVCLDSSYRFIDTVLTELHQLHQQAGMPLELYHIGADETAGAWQQSPACQALRAQGETDLMRYFLKRTAALLNGKGVRLAAWSDGLKHLSADDQRQITSYVWQTSYDGAASTVHQQANQGWQVVLALPDATYFDVPNLNSPYARGNHWASRQLSTEKVFSFQPQNLPALAAIWRDLNGAPFQITDNTPLNQPQQVIGLQGNLWTEVIPTADKAWQMLLPRMLALAERSWHRASWQPSYQPGVSYAASQSWLQGEALRQYQADWTSFQQRVWQHEAPALLAAGLPVQLPWAGVALRDGQLHALTEPGLAIEYQRAGQGWLPYQGPLRHEPAMLFRSRLPATTSPNTTNTLVHGLSSAIGTVW